MIREYHDNIVIDKPLYITIQRDNLECFQEMASVFISPDDDFFCKSINPKSYGFKDLILRDYPPLLSVCVFFKAIKIVEFLLMNDVNTLAVDKKGRSIAHFAAAGGDFQILLMLDELAINFTEEDSRVFNIINL